MTHGIAFISVCCFGLPNTGFSVCSPVTISLIISFSVGLISVTTDKRWKGLEEKLRDIAGSFKVQCGINILFWLHFDIALSV